MITEVGADAVLDEEIQMEDQQTMTIEGAGEYQVPITERHSQICNRILSDFWKGKVYSKCHVINASFPTVTTDNSRRPLNRQDKLRVIEIWHGRSVLIAESKPGEIYISH